MSFPISSINMTISHDPFEPISLEMDDEDSSSEEGFAGTYFEHGAGFVSGEIVAEKASPLSKKRKRLDVAIDILSRDLEDTKEKLEKLTSEHIDSTEELIEKIKAERQISKENVQLISLCKEYQNEKEQQAKLHHLLSKKVINLIAENENIINKATASRRMQAAEFEARIAGLVNEMQQLARMESDQRKLIGDQTAEIARLNARIAELEKLL